MKSVWKTAGLALAGIGIMCAIWQSTWFWNALDRWGVQAQTKMYAAQSSALAADIQSRQSQMQEDRAKLDQLLTAAGSGSVAGDQAKAMFDRLIDHQSTMIAAQSDQYRQKLQQLADAQSRALMFSWDSAMAQVRPLAHDLSDTALALLTSSRDLPIASVNGIFDKMRSAHVDDLKNCFTPRVRGQIRAGNVAAAYGSLVAAGSLTIALAPCDDGRAYDVFVNGQRLTRLVWDSNRWLADAVWF